MLAATDSWRLKKLQVLSLSTSTISRKTEIFHAHNEVIFSLHAIAFQFTNTAKLAAG